MNRRRVRTFFNEQRSVSVLIIGLVIWALGAAVLRIWVFTSWFLWFWAVTAYTALLLLGIAAWDLAADLSQRLVHLVTDQRAPWRPWTEWLLVPVLFVAGIIFDHLVAH